MPAWQLRLQCQCSSSSIVQSNCQLPFGSDIPAGAFTTGRLQHYLELYGWLGYYPPGGLRALFRVCWQLRNPEVAAKNSSTGHKKQPRSQEMAAAVAQVVRLHQDLPPLRGGVLVTSGAAPALAQSHRCPAPAPPLPPPPLGPYTHKLIYVGRVPTSSTHLVDRHQLAGRSWHAQCLRHQNRVRLRYLLCVEVHSAAS